MADEKPFSRAMIDLSPDDMKLAQKMQAKVGGKVRIVLYGELKALSQRAQDDKSEIALPSAGSIEIDVSRMQLASNNEIAELFDEEFDG
jgi:hypothetical protein